MGARTRDSRVRASPSGCDSRVRASPSGCKLHHSGAFGALQSTAAGGDVRYDSAAGPQSGVPAHHPPQPRGGTNAACGESSHARRECRRLAAGATLRHVTREGLSLALVQVTPASRWAVGARSVLSFAHKRVHPLTSRGACWTGVFARHHRLPAAGPRDCGFGRAGWSVDRRLLTVSAMVQHVPTLSARHLALTWCDALGADRWYLDGPERSKWHLCSAYQRSKQDKSPGQDHAPPLPFSQLHTPLPVSTSPHAHARPVPDYASHAPSLP